jgi:hypothetical protein
VGREAVVLEEQSCSSVRPGGEKRFVTHAGVAFSAFSTEFFSASGCSLLETFHLCHVAWHVSGRSQKECMKPDFAFKHQIACIQAIYKAPCHDAVQHQRGKMVSSTLCVSNEMPGTLIFMMPQKGIHVNVRSITYVYLNSETIPPVLIQHHKESALCICVCVCACVCVFEMSFHDSRALCRSSYDFKA